MTSIARGQTSDYTDPILDLYTVVNGVLSDVAVLSFQIFDVSTGTAVQVYPTTAGNRETLDPTTAVPTGARIDLGHYVATWTPAVTENLGDHEIHWFFQLTASDPEVTWVEAFSVTDTVSAEPYLGYASIQDVRDEGVPSTGYGAVSDSRISSMIEVASRQIEGYTGRFFGPRAMTLYLNGSGHRALMFNMPVISISDVSIMGQNYVSDLDLQVEDYRVYNRHLTEGLLDPDDRNDPRVELIKAPEPWARSSYWFANWSASFTVPAQFPTGTQNIKVSGVFGYTEPDGTATGRIPLLIRRACVLMTVRDLPLITDPDRYDARNNWRLQAIKTRDQSMMWAQAKALGTKAVGMFTGDPEIDDLLLRFVKPLGLGAG